MQPITKKKSNTLINGSNQQPPFMGRRDASNPRVKSNPVRGHLNSKAVTSARGSESKSSHSGKAKAAANQRSAIAKQESVNKSTQRGHVKNALSNQSDDKALQSKIKQSVVASQITSAASVNHKRVKSDIVQQQKLLLHQPSD